MNAVERDSRIILLLDKIVFPNTIGHDVSYNQSYKNPFNNILPEQKKIKNSSLLNNIKLLDNLDRTKRNNYVSFISKIQAHRKQNILFDGLDRKRYMRSYT